MHINETKRIFFSVIKFIDGFLPFFFWLLLIFGFGDISSGILTVAAAAIHESGHICYRLFSGDVTDVPHPVLGGLRLSKPSLMSYSEELVYASFGPLFNIAAVLISLPFFGKSDEYVELFALFNLMTAFSNLIPIDGYDGYRIIYCLLCRSKCGDRLLPLLESLSSLLIGSFVFLSLYLMLRFGSGYWIFAVFIFNLISLVRRKLKKTVF